MHQFDFLIVCAQKDIVGSGTLTIIAILVNNSISSKHSRAMTKQSCAPFKAIGA